jgi:ATP phosphoribosyltransferase regulatory subunit
MQFIDINQLSNNLKVRNQILQSLENIIQKQGFIKMEPDYLEPYETFIQTNPRIQKESLVKLINSDGSISVLRPDITTNLIKQILPKWQNDDDLKVYYTASTFRQLPNQPLIETKQLGVEFLGGDARVDETLLSLILTLFNKLGLPFYLEIGLPSFLKWLILKLGLSNTETTELKNIIDTKNQYALNGFLLKLKTANPYQTLLSELFTLQGSIEAILSTLSNYEIDMNILSTIQSLKSLENMGTMGKNQVKLTFDLSMMSTFDYYDGITFKGYIDTIPYPILSGGRYDALTKTYGKSVPASGFSINMTALLNEVIQDV